MLDITTPKLNVQIKIIHMMKCWTLSAFKTIKIITKEKKSSPDKDLLIVFRRLEKLNLSWKKPVPKYYKIWTPNNEIRLWSVPRTTGKLLKSLVMETRAKTILELGTSAGYSTLWLAWGTRSNHGKVYTIELDKIKINMAKKNFINSKMSDYIVQIQGDIDEEIRKWNRPLDFVFFDAEKTKYLTYLKHLLPYLNRNGVIVADNAINYADKMQDFLEFIQTDNSLDNVLLNIDNGLLLIGKKDNLLINHLKLISK